MATKVRTWFKKKVSHATSGDAGHARSQPSPGQEAIVNYIQHMENANFGVNYGYQSMSGSINASDPRSLDSLPQHPDVSGRRSEYLQDSRREESKFVHSWLDRSPEMVLCIHAAAGLGKSTFVHHLAADLRSSNRLAAALFMGFIPSNWGPDTIVRLIAGELGRIHGDAIPTIANAIRKFSGASLSAQQLFGQYIANPIQSLKLNYPLAVLVDAIDEWGPHLTFLKQLSYLERYRHLVRFIILGRTKLRATELPGVSIAAYPLPPVSKEVMIRFFKVRFAEVEWGDGGKPKGRQIDLLADKANGVFVWASTVCSMVSDSFTNASPSQVVEQTLRSRRTVGDSEGLAELYHGALIRSFPRANEREYVRKFLHAIFVLEEPLPTADFAFLIDMELRTVHRIRSGLSPLQSRLPKDTEEKIYPANAIFHMSVMEYFLSASTPREFSFCVTLLESHAILAEACLHSLPKLFSLSGGTAAQRFRGAAEYVVRKWPIHATRAIPYISPDVGLDKTQTRLCTTLQSLPIESLKGWADCLCTILMNSYRGSFNMHSGRDHEAGSLLYYLGKKLYHRNPKATLLKIACVELAVRLEPGEARYWSYLGQAYHLQAELESSRRRGEQAIGMHRHAVQLASVIPGVDEAEIKVNLASCLGAHFNGYREPHEDELTESVTLHREVLQLRPEGHKHRPISLNNLAQSLHNRFLATNAFEDLEESIQLHRDALNLAPDTSPELPQFLQNLADVLCSRFDVSKNVGDLKESVQREREALNLSPEGHTINRSDSLHSLAVTVHTLFQATADTADLDECIQLYRDSLDLRPADDPDFARSMYNLATSLYDHSMCTGATKSLEESIKLHRAVLRIPHEGHPDRVTSLEDLARCIRKRGGGADGMEDLEDDINACREVLNLRPKGHPDRVPAMYRFASFLYDHFGDTKAVKHLDESIKVHRKVLNLRPKGHPDRLISLYHLSFALRQRFLKVTPTIRDLKENIQLDREALELLPEGHPDRSGTLRNVAVSLRDLFQFTHDLDFIQQAFQLDTAVLRLRPQGHPERHLSLRGLGLDHYFRFRHGGAVEDLRLAISFNERSLALCPPEDLQYREMVVANITSFKKVLSTLQPLAVVEGEMGRLRL